MGPYEAKCEKRWYNDSLGWDGKCSRCHEWHRLTENLITRGLCTACIAELESEIWDEWGDLAEQLHKYRHSLPDEILERVEAQKQKMRRVMGA